jgi:hypothetical protein
VKEFLKGRLDAQTNLESSTLCRVSLTLGSPSCLFVGLKVVCLGIWSEGSLKVLLGLVDLLGWGVEKRLDVSLIWDVKWCGPMPIFCYLE